MLFKCGYFSLENYMLRARKSKNEKGIVLGDIAKVEHCEEKDDHLEIKISTKGDSGISIWYPNFVKKDVVPVYGDFIKIIEFNLESTQSDGGKRPVIITVTDWILIKN